MTLASEQLTAYLNGTLSADQISPAVLSWSRLSIHYMALEVLEGSTREDRRALLNRVPEHLRGRVENEARRLYKPTPP